MQTFKHANQTYKQTCMQSCNHAIMQSYHSIIKHQSIMQPFNHCHLYLRNIRLPLLSPPPLELHSTCHWIHWAIFSPSIGWSTHALNRGWKVGKDGGERGKKMSKVSDEKNTLEKEQSSQEQPFQKQPFQKQPSCPKH